MVLMLLGLACREKEAGGRLLETVGRCPRFSVISEDRAASTFRFAAADRFELLVVCADTSSSARFVPS